MRRLPGWAKAAVGIALLQGAAVAAYLAVEAHRAAGGEFRYERLPPGRLAPDLVFTRPDGSARRLSDLRGRRVLLHFWATWCPPCREELPRLLALGRERSTEVLAVALDRDWSAVAALVGPQVPPEVVQDRAGQSQALYDVASLPETYLVGPDGALLVRISGARDWGSRGAQDLLGR